MTPHTGFLLAAVLSLLVTLPVLVWRWYTRRPHWMFAAALYFGGYLLIGAAFIVDAIAQPPLFVHGFVPGIGSGMIVVALVMDVRWIRALPIIRLLIRLRRNVRAPSQNGGKRRHG